MAGAPLRGPPNLLPLQNDVEFHGLAKAGSVFPFVAAGGENGGDADLRQGDGHGFMKLRIALGGGEGTERVIARRDDGVGDVALVVDEAAAGVAADEGAVPGFARLDTFLKKSFAAPEKKGTMIGAIDAWNPFRDKDADAAAPKASPATETASDTPAPKATAATPDTPAKP